MSRAKLKRLAAVLALAGVATLTGCGSSQNDEVPIAAAPAGVMPGGVVGAGACVPISGQIPFSASNAIVDSANIYAGQIPGGTGAVGTVMIGGAVAGGPYGDTTPDGSTISMNIMLMQSAPSPYGGSTGYGPQQANLTGFIQLSQAAQTELMYQSGGMGYSNPGYFPQNPMQPTMQPCVSGIAINVGHYNTRLYGGSVYFYLNNGQSIYRLLI